MKKTLFGTFIFIGVLLLGLMIVRGEDLYRNNHYTGDDTTEEQSNYDSWMHSDDTYGHMGGYGMMGNNYYGYESDYCHDYNEDEKPSYEYLYSHLTLGDQEKIDVLYAEMLSEYDFSLMTDLEKLETIEIIKDALVDEILENYSRGW